MICSRCQQETHVAVYTPDATGRMQPMCTGCSGQLSDQSAMQLAQALADTREWKRIAELRLEEVAKWAHESGTAKGQCDALEREVAALKAALKEACGWLEASAADYPAEQTRDALRVVAAWRKLAEHS